MIDKETWKIGTERDKMEKFKRNINVQYHKSIFSKKTFSSNVKQFTVFFYER